MTFKVIQCTEDSRKRNIVLHRVVVVPCSPTAIGYNSALTPKSDAYLPYVKVEDGATRKIAHLRHQGTVDLPDIVIPEGGGNWRKLLSSSPKSVDSD